MKGKMYTRDRKIWTKRDIKYLKENLGTKTIQEIAIYLRRPPEGIEQKIRREKLENNNTGRNARNE